MLATFDAFLWVMFGDLCPQYDRVLQLRRVFNHPSLKAVKSKFTHIRCAHIIWQLLEETRFFLINGWDIMASRIKDQEYSPQRI